MGCFCVFNRNLIHRVSGCSAGFFSPVSCTFNPGTDCPARSVCSSFVFTGIIALGPVHGLWIKFNKLFRLFIAESARAGAWIEERFRLQTSGTATFVAIPLVSAKCTGLRGSSSAIQHSADAKGMLLQCIKRFLPLFFFFPAQSF